MRLLQEVSDAATHTCLYDPDEPWTPLARITQTAGNTQTEYFHTDLNGAPLDVTDEAGNIVWCGKYNAWGTLQPQVHLWEKAPGLPRQPLRYAGQYCDDETGLHYNLFRYYDPDVGRFTGQDPIGLLGGLNTYAYAPNTLSYIDPLGLSSFDPFAHGEITDFPGDIHFGQNRISPNFSTIGSQAHESIIGRSISDVASDISAGRISPDILTISYTIDPVSGKAVTLNNRGLAALTESGKLPKHAIYVPYEHVPGHLVEDIKSRPPSKSIDVTRNKDGSGFDRKISRC